jgi:hypothetical protein
MKKIYYKSYLFLLSAVVLLWPMFSRAQSNVQSGGGSSSVQTGGGSTTPSTTEFLKLENPLGPKYTTLQEFVGGILDIVLDIGTPIVALAIIYSGFLFVKARGNPTELEKAKKTLTYTLIGGAILLGSWALANALGTTVKELQK